MKKIIRDHNPDEGGPDLIEMHAVDADHAVASDPERYSIEVAHPVIPPPTLEQRIARIENRLGPETPEEIEHRNRRNQAIAERTAEERAARRAERRPIEQPVEHEPENVETEVVE